jgi:hypothetical protein
MPNKRGLSQRFENLFAAFELSQGGDAAELVELAGCENGHVSRHKPSKRI